MVYRPLFILERMDTETHIKEAYKLLYKVLFIENPAEAQDKQQDLIRTALAAYIAIRRDVRYFLYPMLMKLLSDRWLPYELFFTERRNRFLAFLNVQEEDRLSPADAQTEAESARSGPAGGEDAETGESHSLESGNRAVERGLETLETLFPRAGWDRIASFPDLYPYFFDVFELKNGHVLISPTDPLQQIAILMRIIEELFFGLRYVSFGTIKGHDGEPE